MEMKNSSHGRNDFFVAIMKNKKKVKKIIMTISLTILASTVQAEPNKKTSISAREKPDFTDYPVKRYTGKYHIPSGFRKDKDGFWSDTFRKMTSAPTVNFSGKYFLSTHSCGTSCRYYRLTDLSTGKDIPIMNMFTCADPPPKTSDGYNYMSFLYFRPESNLLVAQYEIEVNGSSEDIECRERLFVLEKEKFRTIIGTRLYCNDWSK